MLFDIFGKYGVYSFNFTKIALISEVKYEPTDQSKLLRQARDLKR